MREDQSVADPAPHEQQAKYLGKDSRKSAVTKSSQANARKVEDASGRKAAPANYATRFRKDWKTV